MDNRALGKKQIRNSRLFSSMRSGVPFALSLVLIILLGQHLPTEGNGNGMPEAMAAFFLYFWLFCLFLKTKGQRKGFIWLLLAVGFWFKVLLALANYSIPLFPPTQDALTNNEIALQLSIGWRHGRVLSPLPEPVELSYVLPMALIYTIFGYNLYLGCLMNIIAGTACIYVIYRIGLLLFGQTEAIVASIIYSVMPYLNFLSVFFNREIIIIFFMAMIGLWSIWWIHNGEVKFNLMFFFSLVYMFFLRPENVIIILPYLVVVCSITHFRKPVHAASYLRVLFFVILILCGSFVLNAVDMNVPKVPDFLHVDEISPQGLYSRAQRHVDFGWAYLPENVPHSWLSVFFPYGVTQAINFLLRPFPWEIFRTNQLFIVLNNIILYCLYMLSLFGVFKLVNSSRISKSIAVLSFLVLSVFLSSLVQGNAFAAFRHREQCIFFIYVLGSSGLIAVARMSKVAALKYSYTKRTPRSG